MQRVDKAILLLPRHLWVFHPEPNPEGTIPIDVAVMRVPTKDFIKTFLHCTDEENPDGCGTTTTGKSFENHLAEPPSVMERTIFFGFPAGDIAKAAIEPFARAGVVAYMEPNPSFRIDNKPVADIEIYFVDAPSFPGNSGGPVLREPLPLRGGVQVLGLVTGGHLAGRDYAIVTSVKRIHETLVHARSRAQVKNDAWQTEKPSLRIRCTPDE